VKEEGEHEVCITVTIAKASITDQLPDGKKSESAPQVQNYLHCQYKLLPDDKDFIKNDIVTFGMAAKMYGDNDSKVLRTWNDGDKTWVAWTSTVKVRITQDVLLKMFQHKFELKLWDTKDKVSAKARFDRPKAFRLPQTKTQDEVDLESLKSKLNNDKGIIHLGAGSSSLLDQNKVEKKANKKVSFVGNYHTNEPEQHSSHQFISTTDSKVDVKVRLNHANQPEFKNLIDLASTGENPLAVDTEEIDRINKGNEEYKEKISTKTEREDNTLAVPSANRKSSNSSTRNTNSRKSLRHGASSALRKMASSKQDHINQNGLACIAVPLSSLFTNCLSISNTLEEPISSLEEVIVILSLDKPLLSDYQRFKLNPMVLTVKSANLMPKNGLGYDELRHQCHPAYVKYKFYGTVEHRSFAKEHSRNIKFNDSNVILLGTLDKNHLFEYLRGPPLKIEVHDRDVKETPKKKSSVFGSKPEDENIFNTAYAGGTLLGLTNQAKTDNNTYGVAEFDLSELLNGERILHHTSPIRACKQSHDILNNKASTVPVGDYLESGSELKIKVELVRSLTEQYYATDTRDNPTSLMSSTSVNQPTHGEQQQLLSSTTVDSKGNLETITSSQEVNLKQQTNDQPSCPYGRIVYIFDYKNKDFLGKVLGLTTEINAKSLDFWTYPKHVIEAALSTYKLSESQQNDRTLDIITGCQIIDGEYHIFVLEGLAHQGVKRLWDQLEHPKLDGGGFFRVLYNSDMTFAKRLYISLDVDLARIRLHQPISNIVKQPLLYVRDMLPSNCFQAVTRLHQLSQSVSLQSVIRNDVLPTVPMIVSLGREFGVPLTRNDLHETTSLLAPIEARTKNADNMHQAQVSEMSVKEQQKTRRPIEMTNKAYDELMEARKNGQTLPIDYINANIKSLIALSRARTRVVTPKISFGDGSAVHNYSTQTLNTSAMAMEQLRAKLAQDPGSRYTYCHDYNSATVDPVNVTQNKKMAALEAKEKWKTSNGFVFPGMKTAKESNQHPQQLDEARLVELQKPWRENVAHANILKPTVDRILFKWIDRDQDFNNWSKPLDFFGGEIVAPDTIHAAGETLRAEQSEHQRAEVEKWEKKLVVSDPVFRTHRCLVATEMKTKGRDASNQIDRKEGILKDKPIKTSLGRNTLRLAPIPHTACVTVCDSDEYNVKDQNVGFHPGDSDNMSWTRNQNCIPVRDYDHSHFENTKGQDFRLVHTDREKMNMKIKPLSKEERATHLFS